MTQDFAILRAEGGIILNQSRWRERTTARSKGKY
jgi:hypothetical protein